MRLQKLLESFHAFHFKNTCHNFNDYRRCTKGSLVSPTCSGSGPRRRRPVRPGWSRRGRRPATWRRWTDATSSVSAATAWRWPGAKPTAPVAAPDCCRPSSVHSRTFPKQWSQSVPEILKQKRFQNKDVIRRPVWAVWLHQFSIMSTNYRRWKRWRWRENTFLWNYGLQHDLGGTIILPWKINEWSFSLCGLACSYLE